MQHAKNRAYPFSIDSERAFLGSCMLDPALLEYAEIEPADFYRPEHGALFGLMRRMYAVGDDPDAITLPMAVSRLGGEKYGGVQYVCELPDYGLVSDARDVHTRQIRSDAIRRRLLQELERSISQLYTGITSPEDVYGGARSALNTAMAGGLNEVSDYQTTATTMLDDIGDGTPAKPSPTGFGCVDDLLHGFFPGRLVLVAGRPGMGKSALAFEMAARVAGKGHGVGVISLEMSPQELVARDLAAQIGVTENAFLVGSLDGQKFSDAVAQVNATGPIPLLFPRRHVGRWGLRDVEREARRFKAECEKRGIALALLVVDYIGLLRVDRSGGLNHAVAVAELADGLKALARELGCCVLAACQLNRGVESRTNKRPRMSDLRDSGGLEQAADVVLLLYRDGYYDRTPGNPDKHILEVNVAKHRQGPTGNTYVTFAPGTFQVWREPTLEMIAGWRERLGGKLNGE